MEMFTNDHMTALPELNSNVFLHIMQALAEGLRTLDILFVHSIAGSISLPGCSLILTLIYT
jgi:hypothetical protein